MSACCTVCKCMLVSTMDACILRHGPLSYTSELPFPRSQNAAGHMLQLNHMLQLTLSSAIENVQTFTKQCTPLTEKTAKHHHTEVLRCTDGMWYQL